MKIKGTEVGTGRPLICVPVLEKTKEEVIKEVEYLVKSDADMIEGGWMHLNLHRLQ